MDPKRHNILIVDDEDYNLDTLWRIFRKSYNIFSARSGEEGLRIVQGKQIALVITDQKMPGMTGLEFLQRLLIDHPHAVRIVLTGYPPERPGSEASEGNHVYRVLTKPCNSKDIQSAVAEALHHYERRVQGMGSPH